MTTLKEDLAHLSGPAVYGLRRWNQDWMTIGIAWVQGRWAWAAAVRDAVVAMEAGATTPRWMPSQVTSKKLLALLLSGEVAWPESAQHSLGASWRRQLEWSGDHRSISSLRWLLTTWKAIRDDRVQRNEHLWRSNEESFPYTWYIFFNFQCFCSLIYLSVTDIYALMNYLGFVQWLAISVSVAIVIIFRFTRPKAARPVRVSFCLSSQVRGSYDGTKSHVHW